jgi:hypothetical protein
MRLRAIGVSGGSEEQEGSSGRGGRRRGALIPTSNGQSRGSHTLALPLLCPYSPKLRDKEVSRGGWHVSAVDAASDADWPMTDARSGQPSANRRARFAPAMRTAVAVGYLLLHLRRPASRSIIGITSRRLGFAKKYSTRLQSGTARLRAPRFRPHQPLRPCGSHSCAENRSLDLPEEALAGVGPLAVVAMIAVTRSRPGQPLRSALLACIRVPLYCSKDDAKGCNRWLRVLQPGRGSHSCSGRPCSRSFSRRWWPFSWPRW